MKKVTEANRNLFDVDKYNDKYTLAYVTKAATEKTRSCFNRKKRKKKKLLI